VSDRKSIHAVQVVISFFKSLFSKKPGDAKIKVEIRRIEESLRAKNPAVYHKGFVQPVFAEALFILYRYTEAINTTLCNTVGSPNKLIADAFGFKLLSTAFTKKIKQYQESLSYEYLKTEILKEENTKKVYENQRQRFEEFKEILSTPPFFKIETILAQLQQLADICRYNYVRILKVFDPGFKSGELAYYPAFQAAAIADLEFFIPEFYYISSGFLINSSLANALIALMKLGKQEFDEELILSYLKKINSLFKTTLTEETLLCLYRILLNNPGAVLEQNHYTNDIISIYSEYVYNTFQFNRKRLQVEAMDAEVDILLPSLFKGRELEPSRGYTQELSNLLMQNSLLGFFWVLPIRILQTFISLYFSLQAQTLLNDICVEGFFCSLSFKSDFINLFHVCSETENRIEEFERQFSPEGENYDQLIPRYLRAYRTDKEIKKKLIEIVNSINYKAMNLIREEMTHFLNFQSRINDVLSDARKTEANYIANIKFLLSMPRNQNRREQFERDFHQWPIFLDIIKNYTILMRVFAF
jgi:hypothetical protein